MVSCGWVLDRSVPEELHFISVVDPPHIITVIFISSSSSSSSSSSAPQMYVAAAAAAAAATAVVAPLHHSNRNLFCSETSIPPPPLPLTSHLLASIRPFRCPAPAPANSYYYYYYYARPVRRSPSRSLKFRPSFSPVMQWQDCTVKMQVDVPTSVAYKCYSDREAIPQWMPFISSVEIVEGQPDLSRWLLKYKAFGRDIEFSWLARNMQPIPNQKIHWRSMDGLPNRGAVRFFPKGASSCVVELTVSYEVPQLLTPVASALQPFLESLLARGLERFARFAKSYSSESR
ncbi:uncharacterized protein LOC127258712 [Andrographis paniculata]|uniref:uncharacterized protein LOC127258712 n=1 Tax=Andrographis paniculata TaxID=175694 RepID=UPI0021E7A72D|nr:uncharacterized protein LOC127258712 [Andrographis paniculata]